MIVFFSNDVGSGSREHDFLVLLHLLDGKCLLLEARKTMCLHHGYYYY